jgi:hypothetical protein
VTFDPEFARLLLEICRYTYADAFKDAESLSDKNDAFSCINCINNCAPGDSIDESHIYLINDGKEISTSVACVFAYPDKNIVAYMGTKAQFDNLENKVNSAVDWMKDAEALPVQFSINSKNYSAGDHQGIRVHKGFLSELSLVHSKIIDKLSINGGKNRDLYITGHSQGAAEAALATLAFIEDGYSVKATYTFAAPRPGNQEFQNYIASKSTTNPVYRLEFGDDIVPHLLWSTLAESQAIMAGLASAERQNLTARRLAMPKIHLADFVYHGVGQLYYSDSSLQIQVPVNSSDEATLMQYRLNSLKHNFENWGDHHHLAGTNAQITAFEKGNYTALVNALGSQAGPVAKAVPSCKHIFTQKPCIFA